MSKKNECAGSWICWQGLLIHENDSSCQVVTVLYDYHRPQQELQVFYRDCYHILLLNFRSFTETAIKYCFVLLKCPQTQIQTRIQIQIQTQIRKPKFKPPEKVQTVKLGQCQLESMSEWY